MFVPTDQAFTDLGTSSLTYLQSSEGAADLERLLRYHIVAGPPLPLYYFGSGSTQSQTTLLTDYDLLVSQDSVEGVNNTASVSQIDLLFANNGIAHELDGVLLLDDLSM